MEAERQATISGTPTAIEAWVQALSGPLAADWSRGTEIERKVKRKRDARWPICLIWSGQESIPRVAIFLQPASESEIAITSIVPLDRKELTSEQRGAALLAFRSAFINPRGVELELDENPRSAGLAEMLSPQAGARFEMFVSTANRNMAHGSLDLPRWYDFLIQLHREGSRPPRETLETALQEAAFSESALRQLLDHYDHTDELLSRYDAFG
jgi:hypothetical protein